MLSEMNLRDEPRVFYSGVTREKDGFEWSWAARNASWRLADANHISQFFIFLRDDRLMSPASPFVILLTIFAESRVKIHEVLPIYRLHGCSTIITCPVHGMFFVSQASQQNEAEKESLLQFVIRFFDIILLRAPLSDSTVSGLSSLHKSHSFRRGSPFQCHSKHFHSWQKDVGGECDFWLLHNLRA